MSVIELRQVSKSFTPHEGRPRSLQELVLNLFRGRGAQHREPYWALQNVSFSIDQGEAVGLIGANGSGKSTCLKLVTRIIEPTSGTVHVDGRVSALLELGTGFHPELTGRENVFLYGSVLGIRRREMAARFDDIVAFAELERFIDIPVKFYSSGMYVRLAFATAIHVSADILLIDEVLAVGDQSFQARCLERIHDLKRRGVTVFFVSHSLDAVRTVCDRALWLDDGVLQDDGPAEAVINRYLQHVYAVREEADMRARTNGAADSADDGSDGGAHKAPRSLPELGHEDVLGGSADRWGAGGAEIVDVCFLDGEGQERLLLSSGDPATIVVRYRADERLEEPMFGLAVHRSDGVHITGPNTVFAGLDIPYVEGEGEVRYHIPALPLLPGTYYLSVSICDHSGMCAYDYHNLAYRFRVQPGSVDERYGVVHIPAYWEHRPLPVLDPARERRP